MRIAIPIWGDKISPLLDTASILLIVEVGDEGEKSRYQLLLDEANISRRSLRIRNLEIDTLICGAVSRPFFRMLLSAGIEIIPEISGHPENILQAYLNGNIFHSRFMMPGCRRSRYGRQSWKRSQQNPSFRRRKRRS
jgi:predicted Fe-Mo cluster-binding NifX family protein